MKKDREKQITQIITQKTEQTGKKNNDKKKKCNCLFKFAVIGQDSFVKEVFNLTETFLAKNKG